ncbi:MAG: long-chain fatty acid--CoA ligase, partial [Chloroflexi bacterium]|nr:long-chain fatty acid--CoA ligase [Chloroflexota bacterium]
WNAGAFLPYQLAVEVEDKLGGTIMSGLGAADFGGTMIPELTDSRETRFLTVGKGKAGTVFRIVDENGQEVKPGEVGEIWGAGPSAASGYYMDPETTWQAWTRDGWFKTGDLGHLDAAGNLVLSGRKKDIIIRGGQNLYPSEIESLLSAHPAVAEVAIVGMPDPVMGEKACAYVVPHPGRDFSFDEMSAYLKSKGIAMYKIPERLEIAAGLPMVGGGVKIDKKALVQDISRKLKAEGKL